MTLNSSRCRTTTLADSHLLPFPVSSAADRIPTASSLREAVQTSWWLIITIIILDIPDRPFVRRLAILTKVLRYPPVKFSNCILSCKCSQSKVLPARSLCDCLLHFKFVTIFKKNTADARTILVQFLRST